MSASKMDENPDTYCVRMPMQSTPRERIMEREHSPIDRSAAAAAAAIPAEAASPKRDKPARKIGEGIHDAMQGRLLPLGADDSPRRST
jgi:hypothetical protein